MKRLLLILALLIVCTLAFQAGYVWKCLQQDMDYENERILF